MSKASKGNVMRRREAVAPTSTMPPSAVSTPTRGTGETSVANVTKRMRISLGWPERGRIKREYNPD